MSKSEIRRIQIQLRDEGLNTESVTDEDYMMFIKALMGPYTSGGYQPE